MRCLPVLLCVAALAAACATSPLGRSQFILVSDEEMAQTGAQSFALIAQKTPVSQNGSTVRYVSCVANTVTREMTANQAWDVKVFESKEVNAFALPGGKIGVYTGLLKVAKTQDQLAAVLGHEVSHVVARHSAERYSQSVAGSVGAGVLGAATGIDPQLYGAAGQLLLLRFSRTQESEADLLGLDYMARAGFDPRGAVSLWRNMAALGGDKPAEILSTHPSDETRIQALEARLPQDILVYEQARVAGRRPLCT